jgi:cytochrome c oxidase cbb3-type subunit 2
VLIYSGALFTVLASLVGLVLEPQRQLGVLGAAEVVIDPVLGTTGAYPQPLDPWLEAGRGAYRSLGCVYCHTQQVRPEGFGADQERGWGARRTVARDYLYDSPHLLGTMRTGPDLANIGARQPSNDWHHLHLYDPRLTSPGSIMPSFAFLYSKIVVGPGGKPPLGAVKLPTTENEYIVPGGDAARLVGYLRALDKGAPLPEATR